jgi:hypothetical protein
MTSLWQFSFLFTLIVTALIILTTATAPTFAQNNANRNGTIVTDNMTVNGGGENATETAESGSISSFHSYCPLSFC